MKQRSHSGCFTKEIPNKEIKRSTTGKCFGPHIFLIFIQLSYPGSLKKHNVSFKLYADDTQFYFFVTTIQGTMSKIEEVMTDIKN